MRSTKNGYTGFSVLVQSLLVLLLTLTGISMIRHALYNNTGEDVYLTSTITVLDASSSDGSLYVLPINNFIFSGRSSPSYKTVFSIDGERVESTSRETYDLLKDKLGQTLNVGLVRTNYNNGNVGYRVTCIYKTVDDQASNQQVTN